MTGYEDKNEREPLSWREIDRRRDRSPHAPKEQPREPGSKASSHRSDWVMKKFRKEADKLFQGQKGTSAYRKALHELDKSHGTSAFEEASKTFLDRYGMPDDWNTLSMLLDHPGSEKGVDILKAMKALYETRSPMERQGFKARVDILAMTAGDGELRDFAQDLLDSL
jgi:hypothetical protein